MPPTERTAYLVVHGVGDPDPGDTLRELVRGLTAVTPATAAGVVGTTIALTEERVWVPEPDPDPDPDGDPPRSARAFLVPLLRDDADGRVLAEVNWADLSRFPLSVFGLFEGFFSLLFGVRHVAAAAAPPAPPRAVWLDRFGRVVAHTLIGPLAATNLLMLFLLAAAGVADWRAPGSFAGPDGLPYAYAACALAAALGAAGLWLGPLARRVDAALRPGKRHPRVVAFARWVRSLLPGRSEVYRWLALWLLVVSVSVLVAAWAARWSGRTDVVWAGGMAKLKCALNAAACALMPDPERVNPAEPPEWAQLMGELDGGVVYVAAVAVYPMSLAFLVANAAAFLAGGVFLTRFAWRSGPARRSAVVATLLPFAMLFGWCVLIPFAWLAGGVLVSDHLPLSPAFPAAYRVLLDFVLVGLPVWFVLLGFLALAGAASGVFWWWQRATDHPRKRLIVARCVLFILGLGCVVLPAVVLAQVVLETRFNLVGADGMGNAALKWMLAAVPFLPLALKLFFPPLRSSLDLVFDVVTHFKPRYPAAAGDQPPFPIRVAIRARLAAVAGWFADRARADEAKGVRWHLVILSHSQGTMVAVGALNDGRLTQTFKRFKSVRLVTMGSPLGHIYQHYFDHHYPPLGDAYWATLRGLLKHVGGTPPWLNVYRADDYVGRAIGDKHDAANFVKNVEVEYHGHTGYWSDPQVMEVLRDNGLAHRPGAP